MRRFAINGRCTDDGCLSMTSLECWSVLSVSLATVCNQATSAVVLVLYLLSHLYPLEPLEAPLVIPSGTIACRKRRYELRSLVENIRSSLDKSRAINLCDGIRTSCEQKGVQ